jgi:hypothetical protein
MVGIDVLLTIVGMVLTLVLTIGVGALQKMHKDLSAMRDMIQSIMNEHHEHIVETEKRLGKVEVTSSQHEHRILDLETRLLAHMFEARDKWRDSKKDEP